MEKENLLIIENQLKTLLEKINKMEAKPSSRWREAVVPALVGFIFALLSSNIGSYFSTKLQSESQLKREQIQKQKQVYSQLKGIRFTRTQFYLTYLESNIKVTYYEGLWKLKGSPNESFEFQEAARFQHKSEEMIFKIAEINQSLYEALGTVKVYFPSTIELNKLIERIDKLDNFTLSTKELEKKNAQQLLIWMNKVIKEAKVDVETEYGKPVVNLLDYLTIQIKMSEY